MNSISKLLEQLTKIALDNPNSYVHNVTGSFVRDGEEHRFTMGKLRRVWDTGENIELDLIHSIFLPLGPDFGRFEVSYLSDPNEISITNGQVLVKNIPFEWFLDIRKKHYDPVVKKRMRRSTSWLL